MRITIAMSSTGLFYAPGLAAPVVIEVSALPAADAVRIETLVRDTVFFDREAAPETLARPVPDARQVTVTVEEAGRSHTLLLAEPIKDPGLKALVECLQDHARALRDAKRQP